MVSAGNGEPPRHASAAAAANAQGPVVDLTAESGSPAPSARPPAPSNYSAHALSRIETDILKRATMIAVLDTNYLLSSLPLIQSLTSISLRYGLVVVVPWVVIQELDGLKTSRSSKDLHGLGKRDVGFLARSANRYLDDELGRADSSLRCQMKTETLQREEVNDDKILDCCMYFIEATKLPVTILSMDRNLCVKARIHGCTTCGVWEGDAIGLISAIRGYSQEAMTPLRRKLVATAADADAQATSSDTRPVSAVAAELRPRIIAQPKPRKASGKSRPRLPTLQPLPPLAAQVAAAAPSRQPHIPAQQNRHQQEQFDSGTESAEGCITKRLRSQIPVRASQRAATSSVSPRRAQAGREKGRHRPAKPTSVSGQHAPQSPVSSASTSNGCVFGRKSSEFTFSMPSPVSSSSVSRQFPPDGTSSGPAYEVLFNSAAKQQQPVAQVAICISDSESEEMDVDMADAPEQSLVDVCNRTAPAAPSTAKPLTQPPSTPQPRKKRACPDSTPTVDDGPVLIYLDSTPDKDSLKVQNMVACKPALSISREIVSFMCSSHCALTALLVERLKKGGSLSSTCAEPWTATLQRRFELPPWKSSTAILTVMLSYWTVFSRVFPKDMASDIRKVLPWVMYVESVSVCPQAKQPLPPEIRISPFVYSKASRLGSDVFMNAGMQAAERKEQTIELVRFAKRILAQCELSESDSQEARRRKAMKEWVTWYELNS